MVKFRAPDQGRSADAQRQYLWRTESLAKLRLARSRRLAELEGREAAIKRALDAYRDLPGRNVPVWLRSEFVALRRPRPLPPTLGGPEREEIVDRATLLSDDYRTRPPCTKLLMRRTHALQTYLTMAYVAHVEAPYDNSARSNRHASATRVDGQESWAVLCGRWVPSIRARRARISRDLEELVDAELVSIKTRGAQGRYEHFTLLSDNGTGATYRPPKPEDDIGSFSLPASFFTQGWHLVLTPAEIAVLLMVRHRTGGVRLTSPGPGTGITRMTRWEVYGISGEAYGAIHELREFGLLIVHDTMPNRRHGKLRTSSPAAKAALEAEGESLAPVPYCLTAEPDRFFNRPALETVHRSLLEYPSPPRLSS
jgi:hypothetical protein